MTRPARSGSPRGVRVPQQARSRRTRRRILEAAVACFEEAGFDATTTGGIARRAGVGVGTLYAYFPDKRAILLELLSERVEPLADLVVAGLDPERWREAPPRDAVRPLIDAVFHARTVSPGLQRILWERFFKDEEFRAAFGRLEARVRDALRTLIEELRESGRARACDPDAAAAVVYRAIEWNAAHLMLGEEDEGTIEAAVEASTEMVTRFLFRDAD